VGDSIYVLGGVGAAGSRLDNVERAVFSSGSLDAFATVENLRLGTPRGGHRCAITSSFLYVLGGVGSNSMILSSAERTTLQ
jgi:hypothetical protein